jgi:hypothetical protein
VFEGADTREGQTEKNWAKLHEGACWLWEGPEGEIQVFVSPGFSAWFIQVTFNASAPPTLSRDVRADDLVDTPTELQEVYPP